jgi:NAD(P)-dependent dehydrogenase (short-subunit alcohol dehydrogenase family)
VLIADGIGAGDCPLATPPKIAESVMETTIGDARGGVATQNLQGQRVLITGGSRGLGLAMVKALLARGARVTVLARHRAGLGDVERLGADGMQGDATDAALMDGLVANLKPAVLILNAGATPHMSSIDEQNFDSFSVVWNTDVKAALHGVQAALKAPMPKGGRVLLASSGAAMVLSLQAIRPEAMRLSGGYIGAKRVIWLMAHNANGVAQERGLDLHFQVLLPLQLVGETGLGHTVASAYAERDGTTVEDHMKRYGTPLLPEQYGEQVTDVLTEPRYAAGIAYGFRRDTPIMALDV